MQFGNVSDRVDSCNGLIAKKAIATYRHLGDADKRWLDEEDILQEGLILAWQAEGTYLPMKYVPGGHAKKNAKYSTWLYWLLDHRFSNLTNRLNRASKTPVGFVELDALPDGIASAIALAPVETTGVEEQYSSEMFLLLCSAVDERAIVMMVRGLLFADVRAMDRVVCADIGRAAAALDIRMEDLSLVCASESIRKKVLTGLSESGMISEGAEESIRLLQCTECGGKFSIAAIRENRFYVDSMTCGACYRAMQKSPPVVSCFGKPKSPESEGYSASDVECSMHCRDRAVCKRFIKGNAMAEDKTVEETDFSDVEEKAAASKKEPQSAEKKKTGKKKVVVPAKVKGDAKAPAKKDQKPAKAAKPAKEKKEKEADDRGEVPKELGGKWPFRNGSLMDFMWRNMYAGCSQKALHKDVISALVDKGVAEEDAEKTYKNVFKTGPGKLHNQTHTWKLNEEGGRYKIYDVKYLG